MEAFLKEGCDAGEGKVPSDSHFMDFGLVLSSLIS